MLRAWSTHRIKPRERYPVIADAINATVCPCEVQTDIPMDRFEAELEHIALGEVSVVRYASMGSQLAIRRHKHLQASDPDAVLLYLPLTARFRVEQSGQALSVDPGTLALVPLTRPLVGLFEASNTAVGTGVQVRMPQDRRGRGARRRIRAASSAAPSVAAQPRSTPSARAVRCPPANRWRRRSPCPAIPSAAG